MVKSSRMGIAVLTVIVLFANISCNPTKKYEEDEKEAIQQFLTNNPDLHFEQKTSGLYYLDIVVGLGKLAETHDTAYVFFSGFYLNGTKFATNFGTTDTIIEPVKEEKFILGFDEALTYMKAGGKAKILLPSNLAYGNYTPLLYEIYLPKLVAGPGPARK